MFYALLFSNHAPPSCSLLSPKTPFRFAAYSIRRPPARRNGSVAPSPLSPLSLPLPQSPLSRRFAKVSSAVSLSLSIYLSVCLSVSGSPRLFPVSGATPDGRSQYNPGIVCAAVAAARRRTLAAEEEQHSLEWKVA